MSMQLWQNQRIDGYRIFLSGPGGTEKSHVVKLIQRDMSYFVYTVVNADYDQPIVLMTAPTGSAAFQIGGSTIDSAWLLYDESKNKSSWEKKTIMQIRLEYLTLLLMDEISMVGFKKFQDMNWTICSIKGSHDANWGNICVLAVADLYQLPPAGQWPIYMSPQKINSVNDFAPNGWDDMQLHEITQTIWQKDLFFAECLNTIWMTVPQPGSVEDIMLQKQELKIGWNHSDYPKNSMHIYAKNCHCDEWNDFMLGELNEDLKTCHGHDTKKDTLT